MDNSAEIQLKSGAMGLGVELTSVEIGTLLAYLAFLLEWNQKINLTAVTTIPMAIELHLLDSLAARTCTKGAPSAVDLGAGGGLPGIVLAILEPAQEWTLVDAVGKKVGFLKAAAAHLGLRNVRAIHARAEGVPDLEHLPLAHLVISRALMAPEPWLQLAQHYLLPGGKVAAMLGAETATPTACPAGMVPVETYSYRLPQTGADRRILTWTRE